MKKTGPVRGKAKKRSCIATVTITTEKAAIEHLEKEGIWAARKRASFQMECEIEIFDECDVEITEDSYPFLKTELYIAKEINTLSFPHLLEPSTSQDRQAESSCQSNSATSNVNSASSSTTSGRKTASPASTLYVRVIIEQLKKYFVEQRDIVCDGGALLEKEMLDDSDKKDAVRITVNYMRQSNKRPSTQEKIAFSKALIDIFPCMRVHSEEGYEFLFNPKTRSGLLFNRIKHLIEYEKKRDKVFSKKNDSESIDDEKNKDLAEELSEIKDRPTEKQRTLEVMDKSFHLRKKLLKTADKSKILLHYPRFMDTHGLIQADFAKSENIKNPSVAMNLKNLLLHTEFLQEVGQSASKLEDYKEWSPSILAFLCWLHELSATGNGRQDRASMFSEVVENFIVFCPENAKIPISSSPKIIAQGPIKNNITRLYIAVDGQSIVTDNSMVDAVDIFFKIHFVFDIAYHKSIRNFLKYIEYYIFNMKDVPGRGANQKVTRFALKYDVQAYKIQATDAVDLIKLDNISVKRTFTIATVASHFYIEPVPGPSRAIMYQHISQSHSINLRSSRDVHVLLNRTILEESESIDDFVNNDPIIRYDLIPDRELFLSSLQSSSDDNNPRPDTPPFNVQNDGAHDSPSASQDSQESNYTVHEPIPCPSRFDFERLPTLAREGVACRPAKVYPVVGFMLLTGNIIYGAQTSERVQNGKFHICCMGGKIVLPPIPQRDEIQEMLMNQNHFYYEHLKTHIRHYNTSFSFASFMHSQGRIDPRAPPNRGIYIFFLHGVAYHGISHSQPHPDKETAFGQIYFLDPQEAQNVRVRNANQHLHFELDETLTQIFESLMREHNVFAEVYQKFRDHVRDLTPEQNRQASLLFYDRPNQHRCRWHSSHPFASSICRCTVLSPNISIWTWGYNIDLISANSATRKVQLSEYARNHLADRDGQGVGNPLLNYGSLLQQLICDWAHRREQLKLHFIQRMQLRGVSFQEYHNLRHQIFERNEAPRVADLPVEEQNDDIPVLQYANNYIPPLAAAQGVAANQVPPAQGDNQVPPPPPPGQGDNQVPPPGQNPPGVAVLLPSSFPGSPRNMVQRYSDVMSMMAALGKPDLFITFSCNPTWPEIVDNLKPYWSREDQVTLQCRVFHIKLKDFVKQLVDDMIFGRVKYCTYSIEFQKRGLPHAHFLIGLHSHDKLYTPEQVDFCISAEIPRNSMEVVVQQPEQLPHMIHGPCGAANPDAPCMLNGQCTKKYPKNFQNTTTFRSNGYPIYKRPDNGETVTKGDVVLDNRWVVPHNRYLLLRYNCHINVEYCTMVTVAKYLFKYIFKSVCQANVQLTVGDEIQNYEACRFLTSPEAAWQLLCNETYQHSHSILRLSVHLPNEQRVYQRTGRGGELLISNDAGKTTLTEWFASNHAQKLLAEEELIGKPAKDGNAAIQSPTRDATGTKTRNPRIFVEKTGVVYDVPVYIAIEKLLNTIYTKAKVIKVTRIKKLKRNNKDSHGREMVDTTSVKNTFEGHTYLNLFESMARIEKK
ncbi:uncharacterized protein DMENIID0001_005600 [Sergentomyia squamirostris]